MCDVEGRWWYVEGGWMVWAVHQCGWAACGACEGDSEIVLPRLDSAQLDYGSHR